MRRVAMGSKKEAQERGGYRMRSDSVRQEAEIQYAQQKRRKKQLK
jgi:hypothetical protein